MFDYKLKIKRLKQTAEFFSLLDYDDKNDFNKLFEIIHLFKLNEINLKCLISVSKESEFLNLKNNDNIILFTKEVKNSPLNKELRYNIEIEFNGKLLDDILRFASMEGESILITSIEDEKMIRLILNNNDHNYINFCTKKFDIDKISKEIKRIYKEN